MIIPSNRLPPTVDPAAMAARKKALMAAMPRIQAAQNKGPDIKYGPDGSGAGAPTAVAPAPAQAQAPPPEAMTTPGAIDPQAAARAAAKSAAKSAAKQVARDAAISQASPYSLLAQTKIDQAAGRKAADEEMQASKGKALLEARARINLSGGGLSGAASAIDGDISRQADRTRTLTLQEMDKTNRAEQVQVLRDQAELYDAEEAGGQDLNEDGTVGQPDANVPLNPKQERDRSVIKSQELRQLIADKKTNNETHDLYQGDWDTADGKGGSKEEPLILSQAEYDAMVEQGAKFANETYDFWGHKTALKKDASGNYFVVEG